jgi:methionyl-tRNA formyltransferase
MDAGDVADVEIVPIESNDTWSEVVKKIAMACPSLLRRNLSAICDGTLRLFPQNHPEATFTRKLSKEDGLLDFSRTAEVIKNRINALTPHIGCRIDLRGTPLRIGRVSADPSNCNDFAHGEIISVGGDALRVAAGANGGSLLIHELQRPGGKMLRMNDFANGFGVNPGEIIPSHPWEELVFARPYARK